MTNPITLHHATLYQGDCLERMRELADASVDAIVTDPPYGLSDHKPAEVIACLSAWLAGEPYEPKGKGFMGKSWDAWVPGPEVWREVLRVLKPGGHVLAFAGTRSMDLMSMAIRLAGFELRDSIGWAHDGGGAPLLAWAFGSGFPKSLDVSKAIDKMAGAVREVVGVSPHSANRTAGTLATGNAKPSGYNQGNEGERNITAPSTEAAQQWAGWGTAMKPAWEPVILARRPLQGTVAENVLAHGTGALNVDGCRVGSEPSPSVAMRASGRVPSSCKPGEYGDTIQNRITPKRWLESRPGEQLGRWPANLIHDGSDEVVGLFPDTGKSTGGRTVKRSGGGNVGSGKASEAKWSNDDPGYGDSGSAARFFYCAKSSKRDRGADNRHPTVKPTDLMRYLCRLITPPGGTVLDPFMGSGSTGKGAVLEGFRFVGIEREAKYLEIAAARIRHAQHQPNLFHEALT